MKKLVYLLFAVLPLLSFLSFGNDVDVFFGDSITFGNELGSLQYTHRWSTQYCSDAPSAEMNAARSGAAMTPALNAGRPVFDVNEVPTYQSGHRHIFVSYWVNDFLYGGTPATFAAASTKAVEGIISKGWPASKIVLCFNYLPASGANTWPYITDAIARQWMSALRSVQLAKGTSFLDFYSLISARSDKDSYAPDGIHPSAAWNTIMMRYAETSIEGPSGPLPVVFTGISAQRQGAKNELRWSVAQEQYLLRYEVERSTNGTTWSKVADVPTAGTGNATQQYSYTDAAFSGEKQYYRVKGVEVDRSVKQSGIVIVNSARATKLSLGDLFPNPTSSSLTVLVSSPHAQKSTFFQVLDVAGRVVKTFAKPLETGTTSVLLSVGELKAGTYFLRLQADDGMLTSSFVKQ